MTVNRGSVRLAHPAYDAPDDHARRTGLAEMEGMSAASGRQASGRYADQPMTWQTRLFGMGGVCGVAVVLAAGLFLSWQVYTVAKPKPALSVFDVAAPAAPPEPQREMPPGPEQVQKEKAQVPPDRPRIEVPEIQIPSENPVTLVAAKPVIDPGPPIEKTTAPETKPAPPAQKASDAKPTWEGLVLGALNKVKRYPREASFRRQQGVPYIRFVMNRDGKVLSVRLERSSGVRSLDAEALSLPRRASPLPKPPEEVKGDSIELVVPVEFFMS
ncbi:energy transducer TonB family protein [Novosphingobium guangzhouense]|uniref:Energy transducer TonB n=1 Tax=Novosphingobium guangzhouense TaxID=1850347 RepID=A0A2K2FTL8_9SPHN|nr:energy transducer TonB [Novosphingobium guangzhouense]PNU02135.1 energy transducer TonB [Novosphingobium guangzhouense]